MLSDKPWKLEAVLFFFVGVLSCVFFGMLATVGLNTLFPGLLMADRKFYEFLVGAVGLQLVPLVLAHFFLKQHDVAWREFLGCHRPHLRGSLVRAVLVAMLAVPMALTLNELSRIVVSAVQAKPAEMQPTMQVLEISYTLGRRILFTFAAIVLAPMAEEILFRGVLYAAIKEGGYPRLALFGTSILFASIHGSWMTLAPLTFFAIVLALLYERTGSLLMPIIAHASFNAANLISYFLLHDVVGQGAR
jgi:membrane protease YdiL (CAAX protease family)